MSTTVAPDYSVTDQDRSDRTADLLARAASAKDPAEVARLHDEVVLLNLTVADKLAARYARRGIDEDDLRQAARLALVRVVPEFRPQFGRDFLAYAVPTILGTLRKQFRDTGWMIRPPRRLQEAQLRINRALPELVQELGRQPTTAEIAEHLGLDLDEVLESLELNHAYSPLSLSRPARGRGQHDGEEELGDRLGTDDHDIELCDLRATLRPLLASLSERDQQVIRLRFFDELTQDEIGRRIGVSQMQVSRILSRICTTLRAGIEDEPAA